MTRSEIVTMYVDGLKTVLWGRSFDILEDDSRSECVAAITALWQQLDALEMSLELEDRNAGR